MNHSRQVLVKITRNTVLHAGRDVKAGDILSVSPLQAAELETVGCAVLMDPEDREQLDEAIRRWHGRRLLANGRRVRPGERAGT